MWLVRLRNRGPSRAGVGSAAGSEPQLVCEWLTTPCYSDFVSSFLDKSPSFSEGVGIRPVTVWCSDEPHDRAPSVAVLVGEPDDERPEAEHGKDHSPALGTSWTGDWRYGAPMTTRREGGLWMAGVGGVLTIGGVLAGAIKRGTDGYCGSAWTPTDLSMFDRAMCKNDLGSWAAIAWTLVALGALLLLSGLLLLVAHGTAPAQQAHVAPPPARAVSSVGTELAEIARLRDSGALTPEEFEAAKARVLGSGPV